jgi:hypothetical protein
VATVTKTVTDHTDWRRSVQTLDIAPKFSLPDRRGSPGIPSIGGQATPSDSGCPVSRRRVW